MAHLATPLAWFEISQAALTHNLRAIRKVVGPAVQIYSCVKANAYGHGLELMAKLLAEAGVDGFSVADFEEAVRLRQHGIRKPIQVMSPLPDADGEAAIGYDLWVWLHDVEDARRLENRVAGQPQRLQVVVKVDTGMGRLGVVQTEVEQLLRFVKESRSLQLVSVATHFATADLGDALFWQQQASFATIQQTARAIMGNAPLHFQSANSAAVLQQPHTCGDIVRPGLAIYGYWPNAAMEHLAASKGVALQPVLAWKTQLVQIKRLESGANIGYGGQTKANKVSQLGIIPVGYAHGLDYRLSHRGKCLIGGRQAPLLGNICMNITMVNLSDLDKAQVGDEVTILGSQGEQTQTAAMLVKGTGKMVYEVLVNLSPWLERRLTE